MFWTDKQDLSFVGILQFPKSFPFTEFGSCVFYNLINLHTEGSNWSGCLVLGWLVFEGEGKGGKKRAYVFFFFLFSFGDSFGDGLTRCMAVWLVIAFCAYT